MRICTNERALALSELSAASAAGTHREVFASAPRLPSSPLRTLDGGARAGTKAEVVEIVLPRLASQEASSGHSGSASWIFRGGASSGRGGRSRASDA